MVWCGVGLEVDLGCSPHLKGRVRVRGAGVLGGRLALAAGSGQVCGSWGAAG